MRDTVACDLIGNCGCSLVAMDDHLETAGQGPKKFQHRDIEGNTGDGEPDSWFAADRPVHAGKEVDHVAVLDHHALGLPGRTGGVDHICKVVTGRAGFDCVRAVQGDGGALDIEHSKAVGVQWKPVARFCRGEQNRHSRVFNYQ